MTSVDLPEPETPVTQQKTPSGIVDVDLLQVVLAGAADDELAARLAPLLRNRDRRACPARYWPVSDAGSASTCRGRALGDDVAAVLAGAGAEVDEVVGRAHRALVVLDHDHGVAEVAQALQGRDQLRVVALVQADRGLVEDVEDADQARADLGREPDPLRLAARERPRRPGQVQVADADVVEEGEPLVDLPHEQPRDRLLGLGQLELVDPLERRTRRELACSRRSRSRRP